MGQTESTQQGCSGSQLDRWLTVPGDCPAALKRLVPLGLGTADPACQLWDKPDDLARLLYPILCGSLTPSGLCFNFEVILSFKGKKLDSKLNTGQS